MKGKDVDPVSPSVSMIEQPPIIGDTFIEVIIEVILMLVLKTICTAHGFEENE